MEDYLELDLNEIASKAIKEKLESLNVQIKYLSESLSKQRIKSEELQKKLSKAENLSYLAERIKEKYDSITKTPKTENSYEKNVTENKYAYIKELMISFFGIKEKYRFQDAGLWRNLAINYYDNRKELVSILKIIDKSDDFFSKNMISEILSFRMPIDYTKEEIMKYVKNPHYCTNGCVYGVGRFYMESDDNAPHDLFQANKHILGDDVFNEVLNTIKSRKGNHCYLYSIPKYIDMPEDKLQMMGEMLIMENGISNDPISRFVQDNMLRFNEKTLDHLYSKIFSDNQFKMLDWQKFPVKYQQKYLMDKNIESVLNIMTHYSCNWTMEEKDTFLKMYYSNRTESK